MDELPFNSTLPIQADPEIAPPVPGNPSECLDCHADISRIPISARFCPRCGRALFAASIVHVDDIDDLPRWLGELKATEASSQIVEGYAKALYRLGRRYEAAARNRPEAVRCYKKSAWLGNLMAFARLAARCISPLHVSDRFADSSSSELR